MKTKKSANNYNRKNKIVKYFDYSESEYEAILVDEKIQNQLNNFIYYMIYGEDIKTAIEVCYDAIYDIITKEEFLNLCENEIIKSNN